MDDKYTGGENYLNKEFMQHLAKDYRKQIQDTYLKIRVEFNGELAPLIKEKLSEFIQRNVDYCDKGVAEGEKQIIALNKLKYFGASSDFGNPHIDLRLQYGISPHWFDEFYEFLNDVEEERILEFLEVYFYFFPIDAVGDVICKYLDKYVNDLVRFRASPDMQSMEFRNWPIIYSKMDGDENSFKASVKSVSKEIVNFFNQPNNPEEYEFLKNLASLDYLDKESFSDISESVRLVGNMKFLRDDIFLMVVFVCIDEMIALAKVYTDGEPRLSYPNLG